MFLYTNRFKHTWMAVKLPDVTKLLTLSRFPYHVRLVMLKRKQLSKGTEPANIQLINKSNLESAQDYRQQKTYVGLLNELTQEASVHANTVSFVHDLMLSCLQAAFFVSGTPILSNLEDIWESILTQCTESHNSIRYKPPQNSFYQVQTTSFFS